MNVCTYRTHINWANTLRKVRLKDSDEVAFWRTADGSEASFKAIEKGEVLFFNVEGRIVGGGTFIGFEEKTTITELWNKYGFFAGAKNLEELENNIREKSVKDFSNNISYIKLCNIFWFSEAVADVFTKEFNLPKATNPVKKYTIDIH
jgi:hypothetical protein